MAIDTPAVTVPVLGVIGLLAAAITTGRPESRPSWVATVTIAATAPLVAAVAAAPTLLAIALAFVGFELAIAGLRLDSILSLEGAVISWMTAILVAARDHLDLTSHATIVPVAAALLAVVSLERARQHTADAPTATAIRGAEWVLMGVPLAMALFDAFGNLAYVGLLAAESLVLASWGMITEVRRRAFLGVGGLVTASLLIAIIPLIDQAHDGLSGGAWLALGAVTAVVLITAGSGLEKHRERIGNAFRRLGTILEDWE